MREVGDVHGEGEPLASRRHLAPIDVDCVAEGLEGVERNADGQQDAESGQVGVEADRFDRFRGGVDEEVEVLEEGEDAEVHGDADVHQHPAPGGVLVVLYALGDEKVRNGGDDDEAEEAPVPPPVEDVGADKEEGILPLAEHGPVKDENERQEDCELE